MRFRSASHLERSSESPASEGNGQTELIEAIAGLRDATGGSITMAGTDITRCSVRQRGDMGLSHIPEDRHERGLVLEYSIAANLILGQQHRFTKAAGMLDAQRITQHAEQLIEKFDIRPADASLPARALSGGNQQKIVIARENGRLARFQKSCSRRSHARRGRRRHRIIHAQLRAARDAGKGVLLVSADLNEVLALSDRIAVMYGGRVVAIVPGEAATARNSARI